MTTTLEAANQALRNAVRDRLDATPADDPKMQGYVPERNTAEDLQQNHHVTLGYDVDTLRKAKEHMDALAEHYAEWDTFTRHTGDGVMCTRTPAEETLWQSVEAVRDRHEKYGPPTEHFARTAAMVNAAFGTTFSAADWALVMVLDKVARQRGPAATDDAAIDIAGYAACHQECRKAKA